MCFADTAELHAREKIGANALWRVFQWEMIGDIGFRVRGCVPAVFKSGPRKGRPNWRGGGPATDVFISSVDHETWVTAWEKRTGLCRDCMGSGKTMASWSASEGTTMRECRRCNGSGKPKR